MMLYRNILVFFIAFFYTSILYSQQTIQFLSENFNTSSSLYFILNDTVFDSIPDKNQWIINSEYDGQSIYPDVISQDSTYSGTITSAPNSSYLHIHDTSALPVANANFDRSVASDAFVSMTAGLCTYGMTDIVFTFFYTGQGNPDAYAELYYSANGGAWTQVGTKYYGKRKWKYETVTDPIFDNKEDLRFGFRWTNSATTGSDSTSFGVDDIMIVGTFDNVNNPNDISISYVDSVVCQGKPLNFTFGLLDTLCDGTYEIEVSNVNGSFSSPIGTWVTSMSYPLLSKPVSIIIPGSAPPGNCYMVRVNRVWPLPSITGLSSVCFIIDSCANETLTEQPSVTMDTMAVCINSAIDVPFWSFGVFLSGNQYVAELSDSNGSFTSPSIINSIPDEKTYDPALVPSPGQVAGLVPSVDPGCGYYVRVNSTNPAVSGTPWGPFCIRECDVELNQKQDISVCISDTAGDTINVPVDINIWNAVANYSSGNVFSVEVLDPKTFGQVNFAGLGVQASTTSTSLDIEIPPTPGLGGLGMKDGLWYIRLIASNSTNSLDVWSNVIRLTIGAPATSPLMIYSPDTMICVGDITYFLVLSSNMSSQYQWFLNGSQFPANDPKNPLWVQFNGSGNMTLEVQETNNNCLGELSPPYELVVVPTPQTYITGPSITCEGDTLFYTVPFYDNTYYQWDLPVGAIIDTGNNEITLKFDTPGTHQLFIDALNICGQSFGQKNIIVRDAPDVELGNDTVICKGESINFNSSGTGTGNAIAWSPAGAVDDPYSISTSATPSQSTMFKLEVSDNFCTGRDSIFVMVQDLPVADAGQDALIEDGGYIQINASISSGAISWSPSDGLSCDDCASPIASPTKTTTYIVTVIDSVGCTSFDTIDVVVLESVVNLPMAFSPNGDGVNDYLYAEGQYVAHFYLRIFNRWGNVVFETNDMQIGWDGKFGGTEQPQGTFIYVITGTLYEEPYVKQGNITLIR